MAEFSEKLQPKTPRGRLVKKLMQNAPRFVLLLLVLCIVFFAFAVKKENARLVDEKKAAQATERPPVNVVLLDIVPSAISDRINLPGEMEPWTKLQMLARISGTIDDVSAIEGEFVREGDILARIEEQDYRIALDSARARYDLARVTLQRNKTLYEKEIVTSAEIDRLEADMLATRSAMEKASLDLSRCVVRAPMDGVIRRLDLKKGLMLSVGDPMAEILQIERLKAVIGIPESDVAAIRNLEEMEFVIQALDNRRVTGRRYFLSPAQESMARLYRLELEVGNEQGDILPGMFLRADIVKKKVEQAVVVPLYAVLTRNDEHYVYIEKDETALKRSVSLGIMEGWKVQVTRGLEPGDRLIIEGHRDVEPSQQVRIVKVVDAAGVH